MCPDDTLPGQPSGAPVAPPEQPPEAAEERENLAAEQQRTARMLRELLESAHSPELLEQGKQIADRLTQLSQRLHELTGQSQEEQLRAALEAQTEFQRRIDSPRWQETLYQHKEAILAGAGLLTVGAWLFFRESPWKKWGMTALAVITGGLIGKEYLEQEELMRGLAQFSPGEQPPTGPTPGVPGAPAPQRPGIFQAVEERERTAGEADRLYQIARERAHVILHDGLTPTPGDRIFFRETIAALRDAIDATGEQNEKNAYMQKIMILEHLAADPSIFREVQQNHELVWECISAWIKAGIPAIPYLCLRKLYYITRERGVWNQLLRAAHEGRLNNASEIVRDYLRLSENIPWKAQCERLLELSRLEQVHTEEYQALLRELERNGITFRDARRIVREFSSRNWLLRWFTWEAGIHNMAQIYERTLSPTLRALINTHPASFERIFSAFSNGRKLRRFLGTINSFDDAEAILRRFALLPDDFIPLIRAGKTAEEVATAARVPLGTIISEILQAIRRGQAVDFTRMNRILRTTDGASEAARILRGMEGVVEAEIDPLIRTITTADNLGAMAEAFERARVIDRAVIAEVARLRPLLSDSLTAMRGGRALNLQQAVTLCEAARYADTAEEITWTLRGLGAERREIESIIDTLRRGDVSALGRIRRFRMRFEGGVTREALGTAFAEAARAAAAGAPVTEGAEAAARAAAVPTARVPERVAALTSNGRRLLDSLERTLEMGRRMEAMGDLADVTNIRRLAVDRAEILTDVIKAMGIPEERVPSLINTLATESDWTRIASSFDEARAAAGAIPGAAVEAGALARAASGAERAAVAAAEADRALARAAELLPEGQSISMRSFKKLGELANTHPAQLTARLEQLGVRAEKAAALVNTLKTERDAAGIMRAIDSAGVVSVTRATRAWIRVMTYAPPLAALAGVGFSYWEYRHNRDIARTIQDNPELREIYEDRANAAAVFGGLSLTVDAAWAISTFGPRIAPRLAARIGSGLAGRLAGRAVAAVAGPVSIPIIAIVESARYTYTAASEASEEILRTEDDYVRIAGQQGLQMAGLEPLEAGQAFTPEQLMTMRSNALSYGIHEWFTTGEDSSWGEAASARYTSHTIEEYGAEREKTREKMVKAIIHLDTPDTLQNTGYPKYRFRFIEAQAQHLTIDSYEEGWRLLSQSKHFDDEMMNRERYTGNNILRFEYERDQYRDYDLSVEKYSPDRLSELTDVEIREIYTAFHMRSIGAAREIMGNLAFVRVNNIDPNYMAHTINVIEAMHRKLREEDKIRVISNSDGVPIREEVNESNCRPEEIERCRNTIRLSVLAASLMGRLQNDGLTFVDENISDPEQEIDHIVTLYLSSGDLDMVQIEQLMPNEYMPRSKGVAAFYSLAQYFGYAGKPNEDSLKAFLNEAHSNMYGVYWSGTQWMIHFRRPRPDGRYGSEIDLAAMPIIRDLGENASFVLESRYDSFAQFRDSDDYQKRIVQVKALAAIMETAYTECRAPSGIPQAYLRRAQLVGTTEGRREFVEEAFTSEMEGLVPRPLELAADYWGVTEGVRRAIFRALGSAQYRVYVDLPSDLYDFFRTEERREEAPLPQELTLPTEDERTRTLEYVDNDESQAGSTQDIGSQASYRARAMLRMCLAAKDIVGQLHGDNPDINMTAFSDLNWIYEAFNGPSFLEGGVDNPGQGFVEAFSSDYNRMRHAKEYRIDFAERMNRFYALMGPIMRSSIEDLSEYSAINSETRRALHERMGDTEINDFTMRRALRLHRDLGDRTFSSDEEREFFTLWDLKLRRNSTLGRCLQVLRGIYEREQRREERDWELWHQHHQGDDFTRERWRRYYTPTYRPGPDEYEFYRLMLGELRHFEKIAEILHARSDITSESMDEYDRLYREALRAVGSTSARIRSPGENPVQISDMRSTYTAIHNFLSYYNTILEDLGITQHWREERAAMEAERGVEPVAPVVAAAVP